MLISTDAHLLRLFRYYFHLREGAMAQRGECIGSGGQRFEPLQGQDSLEIFATFKFAEQRFVGTQETNLV